MMSYVRWIQRHAVVILATSAALAAASGYLAARHLPLETDLASLLPPDSQSVRDLRRLQERVPSQDEILTVIESGDPVARAEVAEELAAAYADLPDELVARIETDDDATRAFFRDNMMLFAPLEELEEARAALADRIKEEKLAANPLYVDLGDDGDDEPAADMQAEGDGVAELRAELDEARAELAHSGYVSEDGRVQLIIVRAAFSRTEVAKARRLHRAMADIRDRVLAPPQRDSVRVGLTGAPLSALAEHRALLSSMALSATITGVLVALLLYLYFRSVVTVILLTVTLGIGVVATFGVTAIAIGHLNLATAFLVAIVAGNGVNYGVLLLARYREERSERGLDPPPALEVAIQTTVQPTLVASLGAAIAYGSLAVTSFRGFSEFAVIGGVGMMLCWLAAFTTLPALLVVFDRRGRVAATPRRVGRGLARLPGARHPGAVFACVAVLTALAAWITFRYISSDPFEYDVRKLRSVSAESEELRAWKHTSNENFGKELHGASYIAVEESDEVPLVVDALHEIDTDSAPEERIIGSVRSRLDVVPARQERKLAVLDEIRELLDDDTLETLDADVRADLEALRPPDELAVITRDDVPEELARKLTERDGRFGLLLRVRPGPSLQMWNGKDLIRFAEAIRELELDDGTTMTTSGSAVVFADIIDAIRTDGVRATGLAALAITLMVLALVGVRREALAVLASTAFGTLVMVALVAVIGIKVNFLDFVALPITIGLGVDYGINVAHRLRGSTRPEESLETTGAAVLLCSATTIIAYGSLLVSANQGVQSFGLASLIGEAACVVAALVLVPAFATIGRSATR